MQKTTRNLILIVIAVIIILIFVISRVFMNGNMTTNSSSEMVEKALNVDALLIQPQSIQNTIRTNGTLLPNEEVTLFSETAGKITKIYFKEGRFVRKGDLLVKINDAELQARLQKVMHDKELAKDNEYRQRQQFEDNLISQEAYDIALNNLNTINAEIDLIKAQIDKTEIRAPFSGSIGLKYVSEGSYISTNRRIANLIDMNPIKIEFSVPEKYAGKIRVEDRITFTVQGSEQLYDAKVYAIESRIDPLTRTMTMRAVTPNTSGELIPGSFAQVKLIIEESENAIMIPTQALIPELGGQKVFLYKSGVAEPVAVETGMRTEQMIQVTRGLQPGDTLITSGMLQLRLGLAVEIAEFGTK
jgi:membrane fusion protein (multidrug efflux system)